MALPNKDEIDGKWEQAKGSFKEGIGNLTGDRQLEAEGEAQNASGDVQEGWGAVKRNVSETLDDIGDAVKNAGRSANS